MLVWHLVVDGPPRTKKTSNILATAGRRRIVLPSKAWTKWTRGARVMFNVMFNYAGADAPLWTPIALMQPVRSKVNCRALFYREADRGDAVGYYQGLADLLEKRTVIVNDRQIVSWDGSRLLKDAARPRVELWLEAVEAAVEQMDLVTRA